jgi:hypothetical protein
VKHIEVVSCPDVPVETHRVKLGEHVNATDSAVNAVGKRNIDETILSSDWNGWL